MVKLPSSNYGSRKTMETTDASFFSDFIARAVQEDLGDGDHTSLACIDSSATGKMQLLIKQPGILAGLEIAKKVFLYIDSSLTIKLLLIDGCNVKPGDIGLTVQGKTRSILEAERLVLNIVQRMSGIATSTRQYVDRLQGLKTKVLDTRKTTPGMRFLEKEAVRIGGGQNHRMGLYDMILIKDNHIDFCGGIIPAIHRTVDYLNKTGKKLQIEVETRNLHDVQTVLQTGHIHRILLDNFTVDQTREAISLINGNYETESSGGITLDNIREYAECGVDYISVGALTHHISSLDISLKAVTA